MQEQLGLADRAEADEVSEPRWLKKASSAAVPLFPTSRAILSGCMTEFVGLPRCFAGFGRDGCSAGFARGCSAGFGRDGGNPKHAVEAASSSGALSEQAEDAIYRDLGRYVVTFQHLQNELVQLASFALDPTHSGHGRRAVADLPFRKLITKTRTSVGQFLDEHGGDEPEFREHLRDLLDRCGELADHRNKVVHSTYVFLESGDALHGIVRSDMRRGGAENEVELDQELLEEGSFGAAMRDIAEVAWGIGQCRIQLIPPIGA
jgi:hypothetical protein